MTPYIETFREYHSKNPHLIGEMQSCISMLLSSDWEHISMTLVIDCMRHHKRFSHLKVIRAKKQLDFKFPNVLRAYYLHALISINPEYKSLFQINESNGLSDQIEIRKILADTGFMSKPEGFQTKLFA